MEDRFVQEVEMPELERRKHELGSLFQNLTTLAKRRNFIQQNNVEGSIKSRKSAKIDQSFEDGHDVYNQSYENKKSK